MISPHRINDSMPLPRRGRHRRLGIWLPSPASDRILCCSTWTARWCRTSIRACFVSLSASTTPHTMLPESWPGGRCARLPLNGQTAAAASGPASWFIGPSTGCAESTSLRSCAHVQGSTPCWTCCENTGSPWVSSATAWAGATATTCSRLSISTNYFIFNST